MRALPLSVHMPEQVDVKPGEEWLVVTCHNHSCDRTILIDPVGPEMRDDEGDLTNKGVPPALPGRQQKFDISRSRLPRSVDGTPNSEPPSARKESRQRGSHEK